MISIKNYTLFIVSLIGFAAAVPAPTGTAPSHCHREGCIKMCVTPTVTTYPTGVFNCPKEPPVTPCPKFLCMNIPTQTATSTHFCHGTACEGQGLPTTSCDDLPPATVLGNPCWTGCPSPCPVPVTTVGIACPATTTF